MNGHAISSLLHAQSWYYISNIMWFVRVFTYIITHDHVIIRKKRMQIITQGLQHGSANHCKSSPDSWFARIFTYICECVCHFVRKNTCKSHANHCKSTANHDLRPIPDLCVICIVICSDLHVFLAKRQLPHQCENHVKTTASHSIPRQVLYTSYIYIYIYIYLQSFAR